MLEINFSAHRPSRLQGSLLNWQAETTQSPWLAEVTRAGFKLENPGDVSPVVVTLEGLFLVRLVETSPARHRSLGEVANALRAELLNEKRTAIETAFVNGDD